MSSCAVIHLFLHRVTINVLGCSALVGGLDVAAAERRRQRVVVHLEAGEHGLLVAKHGTEQIAQRWDDFFLGFRRGFVHER